MSDNQEFDEQNIFPPFDRDIRVSLDGKTGRSLTINVNQVLAIPLHDAVLFPMAPAPIEVKRECSVEACRLAQERGEGVFLIAQKDPEQEHPVNKDDFYTTGVLAHVMKFSTDSNGIKTVVLMPFSPAKLKKIEKQDAVYIADVKPVDHWGDVPKKRNKEWELAVDLASERFEELLGYVENPHANEVRFDFNQQLTHFDKFRFILSASPLDFKERQRLLDEDSMEARTLDLVGMLDMHCQEFSIRKDIMEKSQQEMSQQQKVDFLQRQIKAMQEEISGVADDDDMERLRKRAEMKKWPPYASEHFKKELAKLGRFNPSSPDYSIQFTYLDTFVSLPWEDYTEDNINLKKIQATLNKDHYGLKEVKERILEQMAVIKLRGDMKAPILCLYGPPGVGKTSLGRSIADAIGREYVRVSLGGLHDEAEIRGHRRTYLGAMPGRIIKGIDKAGKGNPVFVLDEIDKIGSDYKGDPSTALLEVLDPEQNSKFHDNYLDCDYDLSKVMFIATANNLSTLSAPLLDRMEIIHISGYSTEEKVEIAKRHLIPKALKENGLGDLTLTFNKNAIEYIVEHYTRESGVRQLEKKINKVLRKIAVLKANDDEIPLKVTRDSIPKYLGKEEVMPDIYENNDFPGVVTGLAWTSAGGDILYIESSLAEGNGEKLTLTGNLGNVMKESATIALQYVKANAEKFGIDKEMLEKRNVHIHVPEGAIPKDGPSAGITMVTSLVSSFTGRKVREKTAMTGEITLRGKVLPVGGIKEKMLAAKRAGITDVVLCSANRKDIEEIPQEYLKGMSFHYVDTIEDVIAFALPE